MDNYKRILSWTTFVICLLTGIAFSLKSLREPDFWWMLRTGEWIWMNRSFITEDMLSFTRTGSEWVNVKWGYEVIIYLISRIGGPEFIPVLQAGITVGLLYIIYSIYIHLRSALRKAPNASPDVFILCALFLTLIGAEFRMTGRPEMISHLFSVLFILILLKYRDQNSTLIWLLIPLQILWANLHEAFGTGMVIIAGFTAGMWLDRLFGISRDRSTVDNYKFTVIFVLAMLAPAVSPYGLKMILHPFNIFHQLGENKFTTELLSFIHPGYWKMEAYLNLIIAGLALYPMLALSGIKSKNLLKPLLELIGSGYLIIWILFLYLSFSAYRNIPFFISVSAPISAIGILILSKKIRNFSSISLSLSMRMGYVSIVIMALVFAGLYFLIVSHHYYPLLDKKDRFGLQINPYHHPSGAAGFIKSKRIEGPCFSDYLTSSYLLWDLRPEFQSYIDLRDLDVFEASMFDSVLLAGTNPLVFETLDRKYNFNYVVLYRPKFDHLHFYLAKGSAYELVYFDAVAAIYLKRNESNSTLIDTLGYRADAEMPFKRIIPVASSKISVLLTKLVCPFWEEKLDQSLGIDYLAASSYYRSIKNYELAEKYAEKTLEDGERTANANVQLGNIYLEVAQTKSKKIEEKNKFLRLAGAAFRAASEHDEESAAALLGQGIVLMQMGQVEKASSIITEATRLDGSSYDIIARAAQCHELMYKSYPQKTQYLKKWIRYLKRSIRFEPGNTGMKLKLAGAYCLDRKCRLSKKVYRSIQGDIIQKRPSFQSEIDHVTSCLQVCGD